MRVGNLSNKLTLFTDRGAIDVENASGGRFSADPQAVYDDWKAFTDWAAGLDKKAKAVPFAVEDLGPPVPRPGQVFAIGANYRSHIREGEFPVLESPMVFTKWLSSFTGPVANVTLPGKTVDWESELVVVIGLRAHNVSAGRAWGHIAGFTVGQDLTERTMQVRGKNPQFGPSKSFPGFSPSGPWLVTLDEFSNPGDLGISCTLNGERMQNGRTTDMIFSVPAIIEELSKVMPLEPGDVIFTGTPSGVGLHHNPPRFIAAGDELVTSIEGIGQMRHRFVAG